jgi:hypothetical protein
MAEKGKRPADILEVGPYSLVPVDPVDDVPSIGIDRGQRTDGLPDENWWLGRLPPSQIFPLLMLPVTHPPSVFAWPLV